MILAGTLTGAQGDIRCNVLEVSSCHLFTEMKYKLVKLLKYVIGSSLLDIVNTENPGRTCHVCIRGCACHVFGSEISLESHLFGV